MSKKSTPLPITISNCLPLAGTIAIPGDKSISHRALLLSSQVVGTTYIHDLLEGEDVLRTAAALQALGVPIEKSPGGVWQVHGVGVGGLHESADVLDMGNSGTGVRLMMGLLASYPFASFFTGDASLRGRPMGRVVNPLTEMGAEFTTRDNNRLPLAVHGGNLQPIRYTLPVASAQVKSAILLAGLNTPGITTVIEPHATRDHTERMLRHAGATLDIEQDDTGANIIQLTGQPNLHSAEPRSIHVPADPSSAAFLVVAALIVPGSKLFLPGICMNPARTGLFTTLKEMGAALEYSNEREEGGEPLADISVRFSALKGVHVPGERAASMIDEYPILAVAAAYAEGDTVMEGLAELRVKESDRLSAVSDGLTACGVKHIATEDSLTVHGNPKQVPGGGTVTTHHDHRIAMAFLVLGMASKQPVSIDDSRFINTSFPDFLPILQRLGAALTLPNGEPLAIGSETVRTPARRNAKGFQPLCIAIDGPAASGKGTLTRRIAEHFGYASLDTGSLYRAVAMKMVYGDVSDDERKSAIKAAQSITESDLANPRIRQEHVGKVASRISAMPEIRRILLEYQHSFSRNDSGAVLDGRDIGTVVCPDADVKIFITADIKTRARRRHAQLQGQGIEVVYDSVLNDLRSRDERDSKRSTCPLQPAEDAIVIDTTDLSAEDVFERICKEINRYGQSQ